LLTISLETIQATYKLKGSSFEAAAKRLIEKCTARLPKQRPSSLAILEETYKVLQEDSLSDALPLFISQQLQATHTLLSCGDGGYNLQAFHLVAELLDDIVPFEDEEAKTNRKATIKRLATLWKDGAMGPFLKSPSETSLHLLLLLPLPPAERNGQIDKLLSLEVNVNSQWKRSRWTPLHLAAQEGNFDVAERLLKHGASKNKQDLHGRAPASYAGSGGYSRIVSLLKSEGDDEDSLEQSDSVANEAAT
jgi:ankyrin repeat protein